MGNLNKFLLGVWNVGIIEQPISRIFKDEKIPEIRWMKHKYKDRFFADPFLYKQDDRYYYVLAEEFIFYENVGKISLLKIDKSTMKLISKQVLIAESYHLSYPFVQGDMIIPEGYRSGATYAYRIENDAVKRLKIFDKGLIDPTLLYKNNRYWIFAAAEKNPLSELSLFYSDYVDKEYVGHALNPVKNSIQTARPAGRFFTIKEELYRPVQDSEKRYGHRVRIMKIKELDTSTFTEEEVLCLSSEEFKPFNKALHTFNVYDNCIVVDGYKEYHSFVMKPLFLRCPELLRWLNRHEEKGGLKVYDKDI